MYFIITEQLAQAVSCLTAWKPRVAEMELIKKMNAQLRQNFFDIHEKSKKKVQELNHMISQLQKQNDSLKKEVVLYSKLNVLLF